MHKICSSMKGKLSINMWALTRIFRGPNNDFHRMTTKRLCNLSCVLPKENIINLALFFFWKMYISSYISCLVVSSRKVWNNKVNILFFHILFKDMLFLFAHFICEKSLINQLFLSKDIQNRTYQFIRYDSP